MEEEDCDSIPLKETEHYKNQHTPWIPNYVLGDHESEHMPADSLYYLMVNYFHYDFNKKGSETNKVIFSGLVGNGIVKFLIESFNEEKRKNNGKKE